MKGATSLTDYNSVQENVGETYLSAKSQNEYDCTEEQERILYYSWHSENMGKGDVVHAMKNLQLDWSPVAPDSVGEAIWEFACMSVIEKQLQELNNLLEEMEEMEEKT